MEIVRHIDNRRKANLAILCQQFLLTGTVENLYRGPHK